MTHLLFASLAAASLPVASSLQRQPIMAGNWKMNPLTLAEADSLAKGVAEQMGDETCAISDDMQMCTEVVVFPPYPFIPTVLDDLADAGIDVGAQSIFAGADKGAYTGATAASMLKSLGCEYTLAGHSERRTIFKDDDTAINKKVLKILENEMKPVVCIGETKEEYEAGLCEAVCKVQLAKDLAGVTNEQMMSSVVIAYEPVWAIGTGLVCPPDVAQTVHKSIRAFLAEMFSPQVAEAVRIQYGGSVTPDSVDELMQQPDIDGCLVGGASLDPQKFARICNFKR